MAWTYIYISNFGYGEFLIIIRDPTLDYFSWLYEKVFNIPKSARTLIWFWTANE